MDGLEHKDERLHATGGSQWRDKLARLRDELSDGENLTDGQDGSADVPEGAAPRGR